MIRPRRESAAVEVQVMPLIDVVFLLLTFFIFAMVLTVRVDVLDVRLPESNAAAAPADGPRDDAILVIRPDGTLAINEAEVEAEGLAAALETAGVLGADEERGLKIAVDADTPTAVLFDVVERLGELGVTGLRFLRLPAGSAGAGDDGTAGDG